MTKSMTGFLLAVMIMFSFSPAFSANDATDQELCALWDGMKRALMNKDIDQATGFFHERSQDNHRKLFTALKDKLPLIARDMAEIQPVHIETERAKYRIRRKEVYEGKPIEITYFIYFEKDREGRWKIFNF